MRNYFLLIFFLFWWSFGVAQTLEKVNNTENWFPFTPENSTGASVISMNDWLDAPAGKHGFVQMQDENLVFENGSRVKFWGTNICSRLPYVEAEEADKFAAFLAKYGVNAVRFHKFSSHGYAENTSTKLAPEKWERFDYFQHKLKETGIYYGWSHIYGQRVLPMIRHWLSLSFRMKIIFFGAPLNGRCNRRLLTARCSTGSFRNG